MPTVTIPRRPSQASPPPQLPPLAPASSPREQYAAYPSGGNTSPVAPAYSPITPKVQPAFPATYPLHPQHGAETVAAPQKYGQQLGASDQVASTAQYIPQPPPQPFSSEDSTDAIALRAAISSLQFQKKKAQDDIKALDKVKQQALDDPATFRSELASGRLKEQRPNVGDLRAILDQEGDDDNDDDDDEIILDFSANVGNEEERRKREDSKQEGSDSQQPSRPTTSTAHQLDKDTPSFDRIPGPQNVVRMPHVNWDKYHINGEALDRMHEQQRRWPGYFQYGSERGREHAVAAPYSPWLDSVDGGGADHLRKDSIAVTPTVSEHPMETRRREKY